MIVVGIHGASVDQKEVSEHSVVLFEDDFYRIDLSIFKLVHIHKSVLLMLLHQSLEKSFLSDLSLSYLSSQQISNF